MPGDALPVGIVGGGIAGLVCADVLTGAGISWVMVERESRLGGRLETVTAGGRTLDLGAKAFRKDSGAVADLVDRLGLRHRTEPVHGDGILALHTPAGTITLGPRGVDGELTPRQRARATLYLSRALADTAVPEDPPEAVLRPWADEVAESCGPELLDTLFRPLASAVAWTTPERVSALSARLALTALSGSLVRLEGGFGELVDALAATVRPGGAVVLGTEVTGVSRDGAGHVLRLRPRDGGPDTLRVRELVLALPTADWAGDARPPTRYRMVRQRLVRGRPREPLGGHFAEFTVSPKGPGGVFTLRLDDDHLAFITWADADNDDVIERFCRPGAREVEVPARWRAPLPYMSLLDPGTPPPPVVAAEGTTYRCGDFQYALGLESAVRTGRQAAEHIVRNRKATN